MDKNEILRRFRKENGEGDEREQEVFHEAWATAGLFGVGLSGLVWILCLYFSAPMFLRYLMLAFFWGMLGCFHGVRYVRLKERSSLHWTIIHAIGFLGNLILFVVNLAKLV